MDNNLILIIGLVWPEPQSSAAGTRMLQLINLFKAHHYNIVFASAAQESDYCFDLEAVGVKTEKIKMNCSSFDVFIKNLNPVIVLFDRYIIEEQYGWRVQENCKQAIRILDTEDLHALRLERMAAVKKNIAFDIDSLLTSDFAKREIASILRCDLSLIISSYEITLLKDLFKIDNSLLYYLPLFYEQEKLNLTINYNDCKDFIFIGNFLHEPNYDAVLQLKEHIWPLIAKQIPNASLHIYGAYTPQKVMQWHNVKERFLVKGRAASALKVIEQAKVLLAPLRFGAGLKGKLLEAMAVGIPSITTSIGCEGIADSGNWSGFVENDITAFANKSITLYNNGLLWNNAQQIGFSIINNNFKSALFEDDFINNLEMLKLNLQTQRKKNFMGNMLFFHAYQSTKYMARWIEEKNK